MCILLMFISHVKYISLEGTRRNMRCHTELSSEMRNVNCWRQSYEFSHCNPERQSDHSAFPTDESLTSRFPLFFFASFLLFQILNQDKLIRYAGASTARLSNKRILEVKELKSWGGEPTADTICLSLQAAAPPEIRNLKSAGRNVI